MTFSSGAYKNFTQHREPLRVMKKIKFKSSQAGKCLGSVILSVVLLTSISRGESVEFFEKKYKTKITGVKPIAEYSDPDSYYTAIARKLGIFEVAYAAVFEKYGWKKGGNKVHSAKLTRGEGGPWEIMVVQVEVNPETKKPDRSTMKTLEMKYVFIDDKGKVTFPKPPKKKGDAEPKGGAAKPAPPEKPTGADQEKVEMDSKVVSE